MGYLYDSCWSKRGRFNGRVIGNAVFTRWPILRCRAKKWKLGIAQVVDIQTPSEVVTFINYHARPEPWAKIAVMKLHVLLSEFIPRFVLGDFKSSQLWLLGGASFGAHPGSRIRILWLSEKGEYGATREHHENLTLHLSVPSRSSGGEAPSLPRPTIMSEYSDRI